MTTKVSVTADRQKLYDLLGDLPERDRPISAIHRSQSESPNYLFENLVLDLNGIEPVPALFVKPKKTVGKLPVILYNHAHGRRYDIGKHELLQGSDLMQKPPYADALTGAGYATLCIDAWLFGERQGKSESELFKENLWNGRVLWGMMVYDSIRAVDYLVSRPDVDTLRIGILGMSMGSTMAWWLAALDERIKVCVDICCLTDFQALIETEGLDRHGLYYYVPGLIKYFSTAQINALIAPRPHLSLAGVLDPLTPLTGLERIDTQLKQVYAKEGAVDAWRLNRYECGHLETMAMRSATLGWLQAWL